MNGELEWSRSREPGAGANGTRAYVQEGKGRRRDSVVRSRIPRTNGSASAHQACFGYDLSATASISTSAFFGSAAT
jgi:hypothetical protein